MSHRVALLLTFLVNFHFFLLFTIFLIIHFHYQVFKNEKDDVKKSLLFLAFKLRFNSNWFKESACEKADS